MSTHSQESLAARLSQGLERLGLSIPPAIQTQLLHYLDLLVRWNQAYNLTAVRDPGDMVARHLLDSLAVLPFAEGPDLLDVGTGPGLPGIPLALVRPYQRVWLCDSNGKKARFLREALRQLPLSTTTVHEGRVESLRADPGFAQISSRAYASLVDFIHSTQHLLAPQGCWLALKGKIPHEEIAALPASVMVRAIHPLAVPGVDGERCLVVLERREVPVASRRL
jgi:16S rRNA (guanine527-N7)-methyltransferase